MEIDKLKSIWESRDQNLDEALAINRQLALELTKFEVKSQMNKLYLPKWLALAIGIPYASIMAFITIVAVISRAYIMGFGFGCIALIMTIVLSNYLYQLFLMRRIKKSEDILSTQEQLSKLRLSSFRCISWSVFQLPFWSICWVSIEALKENPIVYGGVNFLVFLVLTFISIWLYKKLNTADSDTSVRDFFLSGREWDPISKSSDLLKQIEELKQ